MHRSRFLSVVLVLVAASLLSACAASRAFRQGEQAVRAGDWDAAVIYYTRAVQEDPDRAEYKIALERAMQNASRAHIAQAREFEEHEQLDAALAHYRKALEFDPTNRLAAARAGQVEQTLRERIEATRPRPRIERLRETARRAAAEPLLNPASREPLSFTFTNASLRDVLNTIGDMTGINVMYDQQFRDVPVTVKLDGVTLEQALNQILTANNHWYKVVDERSILVIPETPQKRAQYEEQVIRTFYVSHADVQELSQLVSNIIRVPQMAVQPMVMPNKTANTITIRATSAVASVVEKLIAANDKPRAEIIVDVQILEVNRNRAKQFGINLSNYAVGVLFSPERAPTADAAPPFNLNIISQGVSAADFYLTVPTAVVRFLESDAHTRLIAKPQLRGAEGTELTLNLGDEIPVLSTVFGAPAAGGFATIPQSSFNYRPVGVNITMTPRVTYEGEIVLALAVESSTLGPSIEVAGQSVPSFGSRRVTTRLRLREGESNLLAGLLREDDRRALTGLPGLLRLPGLRQIFSANDQRIDQTDIVMLLTPHIVRTHELTQDDLSPIHIGTQQNIGLTGPPRLIAPPGVEPPDAFEPEPEPDLPPGVVPGVPEPPVAPEPGVPDLPPDEEPAAPPAGAVQVLITPPGTEFRVGGGPYTVPISASGVSRLSMLTLTVTYNPAVLRVRSVQEGSFMRQGGLEAMFVERVDEAAGRVDITVTRPGDTIGASGTGLLAALLFDAAAPGTVTIAANGTAASPEGLPLPVAATPATVTVR